MYLLAILYTIHNSPIQQYPRRNFADGVWYSLSKDKGGHGSLIWNISDRLYWATSSRLSWGNVPNERPVSL